MLCNFGGFCLEANRFYNVCGAQYVNLGGTLIAARTFASLDQDTAEGIDSTSHAAARGIGSLKGDFRDLRIVRTWLLQD